LLAAMFGGAAQWLLRSFVSASAPAAYLNLSPSEFVSLLMTFEWIGQSLVKIVVAVWLWREVPGPHRRRMLWSLFGLTFGLWALVCWLLVCVLQPKGRVNQSREPFDVK
jgi:hypothetical protein